MERASDERQGRDEDNSPIHGLRVEFKRSQTHSAVRNSVTTRYKIQLSGWMARRHRDDITQLLQTHGVPLAALNLHLDVLFCVIREDVFLVDDIESRFTIKDHVPCPDGEVNVDEDIECRVLFGLVDDELNGARELQRRRRLLRPRTTRDVVDALDKVTIDGSDTDTGISCSICLNGFLLGSVATKMPCSHFFHGDCIVEWFHKKYNCPLCRFDLPSATHCEGKNPPQVT